MKANLFDNKDSDIEHWLAKYQTNVVSIYFLTMAVLPLLQKATAHQHGYSGTVINTQHLRSRESTTASPFV